MWLKAVPVLMSPLLNAPPLSTTLCSIPSVVIHVTAWPVLTVTSWSWKANPTVVMVGREAGMGRGARPTRSTGEPEPCRHAHGNEGVLRLRVKGANVAGHVRVGIRSG